WNQNVTITNSTFVRNGRQGITLNGVDEALVTGNDISEVRMSSIDIEPPIGAGAKNVVIRHNHFGPHKLPFLAAAGLPGSIASNISVLNNRLDSDMGMGVVSPGVSTATQGAIRRNGFHVVGNTAGAPGPYETLRFTDIDNVEIRDNSVRFSSANEAVRLDGS